MNMAFIRSIFLGLAVASLLQAGCGGGGDSETAAAPPNGPTEYCVLGASVPPAVTAVLPPGFTAASLSSATSTRFAGSGLCASCHRADSSTTPATNFDSVTGEQVDLTADWSGSMMANAARDPYFLAVVSAESAANPSHSGAIEGKCLTCHAPMAVYEAKQAGTPFTLADLHGSSLGQDGVSCTLCHRIEPGNLGTEASFSGNFLIGSETGSARKIYGPFTSVVVNPMINQVAFTPTYGVHIRESKLCASCHTLTTEAIDPNTQTFSGQLFPEQMPYKEWLVSSFSTTQSCQACHMPVAAGPVRLANVGPNRTQSPFGKHHFSGGNSFMLTMLKQDRAGTNSLGLVADVSALEASIVRARNNLTQRTARLEARPCRVDTTLSVPVTVTNLTGHKFPTSYPSRRSWLHVKVEDGAGNVIFESGNVDSFGEIVGLDVGYEPHYDTISQSGQVQVYETVMRDVHGQLTYRLMHAAGYLKDNRLLPAGMSPTVTDPDIQVVGIGTDANFIGGSDKVTYSVNTAGRSGPFKVSVELLYQSVPPRHVTALDPYATSQVASFKGLYAAADKTPERVASVTLSVP
ncbi:MAG: Por secretion system C-terminal sorting protein [Proteobacteria bacterium]|nr:Por secretion system C-terminal sorting protein [Pseudomonadota bacterium]